LNYIYNKEIDEKIYYFKINTRWNYFYYIREKLTDTFRKKEIESLF